MILEKDFKNIKKDESLARYNTLKIGGNAKVLVEVTTKEDLKRAIELAKEFALPYYLLGGGTNIVVSDDGFNGVVINNKIQDIELDIKKEYVLVGSGFPMGSLVNKVKKEGLSGLEWAAGLPGTLGGAIFGNAGSCGGDIASVVDFVEVFDPRSMTFKHLLKEECDFKYRSSVFKKNGYIILGAMLKLEKDDPVNIMNRMADNMVFRKDHQPLSSRSEGCIFKNIDLSQRDNLPLDLWKEIPEFSVFIKKGMVPAGFLIERAGLKGFSIGTAEVSNRHANFIISSEKAKAIDIHKLIHHIKNEVEKKFNVKLEEEVRFLGF